MQNRCGSLLTADRTRLMGNQETDSETDLNTQNEPFARARDETVLFRTDRLERQTPCRLSCCCSMKHLTAKTQTMRWT